MVVKSKRGRRRYIAVRYRQEGTLTDEGLLAALNISLTASGIKFKVIQFDGRRGIVRVSGADQARAVEAMNNKSNDALETLKTSGTLRTLREGVLAPKKAQSSTTDSGPEKPT